MKKRWLDYKSYKRPDQALVSYIRIYFFCFLSMTYGIFFGLRKSISRIKKNFCGAASSFTAIRNIFLQNLKCKWASTARFAYVGCSPRIECALEGVVLSYDFAFLKFNDCVHLQVQPTRPIKTTFQRRKRNFPLERCHFSFRIRLA